MTLENMQDRPARGRLNAIQTSWAQWRLDLVRSIRAERAAAMASDDDLEAELCDMRIERALCDCGEQLKEIEYQRAGPVLGGYLRHKERLRQGAGG